MRKTALALAALVALTSIAALPAHAGKKKKAPAKVVIGTDAADDWGVNVDATIQPIGDALGMEVVSAAIESADAKTLNFIIGLNSLPPSGGTPEIVRYTFDFQVGDMTYELDGKFTNYSRGACDPTSGQCPPPRDPGLQPFLLRGKCGTHPQVSNLTVCEELGLFQGVFDTAAKTITISVPLEAIGAKSGTKILPGVNPTFGGTVVAIVSAYVSNASMPMDTLVATKTFVVP
jgi:hypothetical protein